jgi:hypothetical protein
MFESRNDEQRAKAIRAIKSVARPLFDAGEDDVILVNELRCTEPGCPPVETVVALMRVGAERRQVKIHKPAVEVTEGDLRAAIAGDDGHGHAASADTK